MRCADQIHRFVREITASPAAVPPDVVTHFREHMAPASALAEIAIESTNVIGAPPTPEASRKLAGGASHRIIGKKIMRPGRGAGTTMFNLTMFRRPLRGGSLFWNVDPVACATG